MVSLDISTKKSTSRLLLVRSPNSLYTALLRSQNHLSAVYASEEYDITKYAWEVRLGRVSS